MPTLTYTGLTTAQAEALLQQYGPNEIQDTNKFVLIKSFISQFKGVLVLLLLGAAIVSFFLGETIDALFITFIVVLNALFGLYQEFKAEKSLQALKGMTVTSVRVIRDGQETQIDNRYLVPGDLIYLEEGAKIPADAKLTESHHLQVNEAALTGESLPVEKESSGDSNRDIFMGTVISQGRCWAQVTNTGLSTRFGQIAKSLSTIEDGKTPLQIKLEGLTRQIGILGTGASLLVFLLSFVGEKSLIESFIFAVSLAVAAVPEGLPAVMTITLAIGVEKMARKKAIVRRLNAIEALGSITLLATDKTGTLTTNQMKVKNVWVEGEVYSVDKLPSLSGFAFSKLILNGVLCSTASLTDKEHTKQLTVLGDATEGSMLLLSHQLGHEPEAVRSEWKIVDEKSFNPVTKRMTVVAKNAVDTFVFTKGAPESILSVCDHIIVGGKKVRLTEKIRQVIEAEFLKFAAKGLRMLAFSYKDAQIENMENQQIFLGFVGIADPVREGAADAVQKAHRAGIQVVMITGDNAQTAEAIGWETGIMATGKQIMTGSQLDSYSDEALLHELPQTRIFARTTPEQKFRLVKLYQQLGEVVAVTGDGVNDALALKQSDVGVAMGLTGTDVAKETADMVITDDNFSSLVNAVEQGRNIFNHIKNSVKFLLACNTGEVLYILTAVIFKLPLLSPLQILYMNLVTDGLPAISFAFSPPDADVMGEKPIVEKSVLNKYDLRYVVMVGFMTAIIGLSTALIGNVTVLFTGIILVQHFVLLDNWLSHRPLFTNISLLKNKIFLAAFFIPVLIHPLLIYIPSLNTIFTTDPLSTSQLVFSIITPMLMIVVLEVAKIKHFRIHKHTA